MRKVTGRLILLTGLMLILISSFSYAEDEWKGNTERFSRQPSSANPVTSDKSEWTGNFSVLLGLKSLNSRDWSGSDFNLSTQTEISIKLDFGKQEWPVNIAFDFLGSSKQDTSIMDQPYSAFALTGNTNVLRRTRRTTIGNSPFSMPAGSTTELHAGVRGYLGNDSVTKPYWGAGLALVSAHFSDGSSSHSGSGRGYYAEGGVNFLLTRTIIGFNIMYSSADADVNSTKVATGGLHFGILTGVHW